MTIYRQQCNLNENKDEIVKSFDELKSIYGSVFEGAEVQKRKESKSSPKPQSQPKKQKRSKKKVEIAYNGSLLPFSLESVNNLFIDFLELLSEYPFDNSLK